MTERLELPGVPPVLLEAMQTRGFTVATPVQTAVVGADTERDLIVSSQTGSGKTVAFGIALAKVLIDDKGNARKGRHPRALVIAPTRELAQQVAKELSWLYKGAGARIGACVGGMDPRRESRHLSMGVDIIVGTPGRLRDHAERKALVLDEVAAVVLDEADEMLDMGFREELEAILDGTPPERRTLLFSATFPKAMEALAQKYLTEPLRLQASAPAAAHEDIEYVAHLVAFREREHAVVNVLRFHDAPTALVFCATRDGVAHMQSALVERGFLAAALSGELSQAERNRAVVAVREGRARVLVATDVAARGLDLPSVALVIHADPPQDLAAFQHRSGRTGRAGRKGKAVVLAPFQRRRQIEWLLKDAHVAARFTPAPTAKQIRSLDDQRLVHAAVELAAAATNADADDVASALGGADVDNTLIEALVAQLPPAQLARALAQALRRDLPAPEEMPETSSWGKTDKRGGDRRDDRRDDSFRRDDRDGPPRGGARGGPRGGARGRTGDDEGVVFRVNVGREQRADPKWLLPMLCRRGGVTKRDIGQMDIGRRETRFAIASDMAVQFAESFAKPDTKDPHIRVERVEGGGRR